MQDRMQAFFNTPTYIEERDGYKIHLSRVRDFWADAVVEDQDGNRTLVNVEDKNWMDYNEFLDAVMDRFKEQK